jgi:hypothetical protein
MISIHSYPRHVHPFDREQTIVVEGGGTLLPVKIVDVKAAAAKAIFDIRFQALQDARKTIDRMREMFKGWAQRQIEEVDKYNSSFLVRNYFKKKREIPDMDSLMKSYDYTGQIFADYDNPDKDIENDSSVMRMHINTDRYQRLTQLANLHADGDDSVMYISLKDSEFVGYDRFMAERKQKV